MAYGKLKADTLVYDDSGSDTEIAISGIPSTSSMNAKANLASPTFTGTPAAPTAAADTNTTQVATTAYVQTELGDYLTSTLGATKASPTFTGTPAAPTASVSTNTTQVATTAFVIAEIADEVGTTVQAYDADTAKKDVDQIWTGAQRGTITDIGSVSSGALNIDLSASNNHKVASSGTPVFTFTNFGTGDTSALGQSGTITVTHTGSDVPTWNGHCNFAGGLSSAPTITADATTILAYYVYEATDNTTGKVLVEGLSAVAAS